MLLTIAAAESRACDLTQFGNEATRTCERSNSTCMPSWLPPELHKIRRGIFTGTIGYSINDGYAIWVALDIDNGELIRIKRYAGRQLAQAPEVLSQSEKIYRREEAEGNRHWVDIDRKSVV